jgi:hypothetical protein
VGDLTKSATSSPATASATASREGPWLRSLFLAFLLIFLVVNCCYDHLRSKFRASNLDERMLMNKTVLAYLAIVEVQADRALVSNTQQRTRAAPVTGNIVVSVKRKFLVNTGAAHLIFKVLALNQLLEDLWGIPL